jgi:hypothetical protein
MIEVGLGVAFIIIASAIHKYVEGRNKGLPGNVETRLIARMDELERRITDIQDVMLSIDEKLKR